MHSQLSAIPDSVNQKCSAESFQCSSSGLSFSISPSPDTEHVKKMSRWNVRIKCTFPKKLHNLCNVIDWWGKKYHMELTFQSDIFHMLSCTEEERNLPFTPELTACLLKLPRGLCKEFPSISLRHEACVVETQKSPKRFFFPCLSSLAYQTTKATATLLNGTWFHKTVH